MLMGPDFYRKCFAIARVSKPEIRFSMQTNLLLYDSNRWKGVFTDVMDGSISTSYDPDERHRTLKGRAQAYSARFFRKMDEVLADGITPLVIGTYDEASANLSLPMYERALTDGFDIRVNYRYPLGRVAGAGEMLTPETYGQMLVSLYERWMADASPILVTPLDIMLKHVVGAKASTCPWTKDCGGRFMSVEPNGDVYNCADFADLGDPAHRFGNIFEQSVPEMLASTPARVIRRRPVHLHTDCAACRHFAECQGGCSRDSVLYSNSLRGKFHYCTSWIMVFDRIKESVRTGEADALLARFGLEKRSVACAG